MNLSSSTAIRVVSDSSTVGQQKPVELSDNNDTKVNERDNMKPYSITKDTPYYFCTDTIVGWQCVFISMPFFEAIIESLKYCQREKGLLVHGYVIMPNHIHTIVSTLNGNLSDILRDYKRYTSVSISDLLKEKNNSRLLNYFSTAAERIGRGNNYKIWQSGSHPEAIISNEFFIQKLNYIHTNPVRKGFVEREEHWMFSSARNYILDDHSILNVDFI